MNSYRFSRDMESFKGNTHNLSFSSCTTRSWPRCDPWQIRLPPYDLLRTRCGLGSTPSLALRLQAPFGPSSSSSSSKVPSTSPSQQIKASRKKRCKRLPPSSQRWQFLMLLPNQLIRDIGYVVTSPSFFFDSQELPLVDEEMFGEDDSWQVVTEWLKGLDADKVMRYFEGRRYSTRLGDHFAACIEYVLKFSPLVSPDPLFISQQVGACTIQNQQALKILKKSKGEFGSFVLRKGGVMSEVIVKLIENDVLIKRFSSYLYDDRGRVKEITDSELEFCMAEFKISPFDYYVDKEMLMTPGNQCHMNGSKDGRVVHETKPRLPEHVGLDVSTHKVHKWRVHYSSDCNNKILLTDHKVPSYGIPLKTTTGHWLKSVSECMVRHAEKNSHAAAGKDLSNRLSTGKRTGGEKVSKKGLMSIENANAVWRNPIKKHTLVANVRTGHKSGSAKRLKQHVELEKGRTAGECDFLFKANTTKDSLDYAWTHVHHWEVSIHFLSYIGPWEVFGLPTPGCSAWHCSGKKLLAALEGLNSATYLETLRQMPNPNSGADWVSVLDALYVAPTIGDTWLDRKKSISSKLGLCSYPNMAAKVSNLFNSSLEASKESCSSRQEQWSPLRGPEGEDYATYRDDPSILRIIPRALVKGYLFYEPKLWLHLCLQKDRQGKHPIPVMKDDNAQRVREFSTSSLNASHWIGWWVYACDFADFARSYGCQSSRWYIAPRNEWLSPIIIGSSETHRCGRILDLVDMLTMILKVGEEASELQPPRQRRLMVVEVCWDPDTSTIIACPPGCRPQVGKYHPQAESVGRKGGWVEVSRGFIVEKSWPESRDQLAHGLTLSWSPTLLGWS